MGNTVVVDSTVLVATPLQDGDEDSTRGRGGAVELATEVAWRTPATDVTDAAAGMATAVEAVEAAGMIVAKVEVIPGVLGLAAASFRAFGPPSCLTVTALAGLDNRVNAASWPSEGELPSLVPVFLATT